MQHSHIYRLFVEKKQPYDVEAQGLFHDLKTNLALAGLKGVRVLNRYDISGLPRPALEKALSVFVEAPVDQVYWEDFPNEAGEAVFAIEYLPGQFDQRADSAAQCLQIIEQGELPLVHSAKTIVLRGALSAEELAAVKAYCINPVDSREAALEKPQSLALETNIPADVAVLDGFIHMEAAARKAMHQTYGLAMSLADL